MATVPDPYQHFAQGRSKVARVLDDQLFIPRGGEKWRGLPRSVPVKNTPMGKPQGGFWTSTYRGPLERSDWADFSEQTFGPVRGEGVILRPKGRVYWMETQEDYDWLQSKFPRENQFGDPLIDWEALARSGRWDGVHVSRKGLRNLAQMGPGNYDPPLYGWDVESTIWFNPSVMQVKGTTKLGSVSPSAARVSARLTAGVIDPPWIKKVRKAWKAKAKAPTLDDDRAVKDYLTGLIGWIDQLSEDILFDKGFWTASDGLQSIPQRLKVKVIEELRAVREELQEGVRYVDWLSALMDPDSREYKMEGGWTRKKFTEENPRSPLMVMYGHVRTRAGEAVEKADAIFSRKFLGALSRYLNKYNQDQIDFGSIPLVFSVGRAKVVFQGFPAATPFGGPLSTVPRTPGHSRHPQTETYMRLLDEAYQRLKRRGLDYLWYGDIYIRCKDCGGENPYGSQYGVGAHYIIGADRIQIYDDPKRSLPQLVAHEVGHRYYYRFMSKADRAKFDSYFAGIGKDPVVDTLAKYEEVMTPEDARRLLIPSLRGSVTPTDAQHLVHSYYDQMEPSDQVVVKGWLRGVPPTSEYGGTVSAEDFAEVFAAYVMGHGLTRDQLERFKEFLGRTHRTARAKSKGGRLCSGWVQSKHMDRFWRDLEEQGKAEGWPKKHNVGGRAWCRTSTERVAARHVARTFKVEVGQPIWYGKYKNKKGIIREFSTNDKGDTIITVEQVPNPTGRKQPKEMKLFKIRPREVEEGKKASSSRVAARYAAQFRAACIISVGKWGGRKCLLKNRDRNYEPQLKVVHEVRDGVEVVYVRDEVTGWVEGLNEFGIGVVNSALQVGRDEAEKKMVRVKGKKSKDGPRILKVLGSRDLEGALETAQTFEGGLKGHSLIAGPEETYSLEMTRKHEARVRRLPEGKTFVRTNHGLFYDDAGYTDGPDYTSSVVRREKAQRALRQVEHPDDIARILMEKRMKDRKHPNNLVRDTDNMRTTSQMILNLTDRELVLYIIPGKVKFEGYENKLPKNHEAKITVRVVEYVDIDGDGTPDVKRIAIAGQRLGGRR
jgi:hypothetical protein